MDLFLDNIDLVKKIVNKMNYGFVSKDDLMQAGLMGLHQASIKYNPSLNVKFNTYASYYIIGEIKKELRENKLIKVNKEIYRIIKLIKQNEDLSIDELVKKLAISRENILLAYTYIPKITSLNQENPDNQLEMLEVIGDRVDKKTELYDALDSLEPTEQEIIKLRYFNNYSQGEISKLFNRNQSNISRMEKKALQKMRKILLGKS